MQFSFIFNKLKPYQFLYVCRFLRKGSQSEGTAYYSFFFIPFLKMQLYLYTCAHNLRILQVNLGLSCIWSPLRCYNWQVPYWLLLRLCHHDLINNPAPYYQTMAESFGLPQTWKNIHSLFFDWKMNISIVVWFRDR